MTAAPKAVFIKTYGCQMNAYDSERMGDVTQMSRRLRAELAIPPDKPSHTMGAARTNSWAAPLSLLPNRNIAHNMSDCIKTILY